MPSKTDWRLQGQEAYLTGVTLSYRDYQPGNANTDHDHCEFCWAKFSDDARVDALRAGYTTEDLYRWVCAACFEDFREAFRWKLAGSQG